MALFASEAQAGVVSALPEPEIVDGKNVYTLGSSTSTLEPTATSEGASKEYDYIDWASLKVPDGSVVKLNGSLVLDDLPSGLEYDWSTCKRLALVNPDLVAAGMKFVVPANVERSSITRAR